jgi:CelD/BcsL family acetyltransferase involved in cellulose biosynthesis
VFDEDELVGLAPFTRAALGPSRHWPELLIAVGAEHEADCEPLVADDDAAVAGCLADHLCDAVRRGTSIVIAHHVRTESAFVAALEQRRDVHVATQLSTSPIVELRDREAARKLLDAGARASRLPRRRRRLAERFAQVEFEPTDRDVEGALDDMRRMHIARWGSDHGPAILTEGRREQFTREVWRELVDTGQGQISVLKLDGRRAAIQLVTRVRDRCIFDNIAFDPSLAEFSLGNMIVEDTLRWLLEQGAGEVDFRSGTEPYKLAWSNAEWRQATITLVLPGWLGRVQLKSRKAVQRLRRRRVGRSAAYEERALRETLRKRLRHDLERMRSLSGYGRPNPPSASTVAQPVDDQTDRASVATPPGAPGPDTSD